MNYSTLWKKLKNTLITYGYVERPKISVLIPFRSKCKIRRSHFKWLLQYVRHELPEAEIIIGKSRSKVFCKGEALNNAFNKSTGDVIVVLDADAYIDGAVIERCANRILEELSYGNRLWFVPYRNLYRLTEGATERVVSSDPTSPVRIPSPPPRVYIENQGDSSKYGHRYGAMITMFPREAMNYIKNFDERFKGWGGEDIALLRALDTLYCKHKTTANSVFHLWHPFHGESFKTRRWDDQEVANSNAELANKYNLATRQPGKMKAIISASEAYYWYQRN